jgi:hypothetical protein
MEAMEVMWTLASRCFVGAYRPTAPTWSCSIVGACNDVRPMAAEYDKVVIDCVRDVCTYVCETHGRVTAGMSSPPASGARHQLEKAIAFQVQSLDNPTPHCDLIDRARLGDALDLCSAIGLNRSLLFHWLELRWLAETASVPSLRVGCEIVHTDDLFSASNCLRGVGVVGKQGHPPRLGASFGVPLPAAQKSRLGTIHRIYY